jgi:hypothetical protein
MPDHDPCPSETTPSTPSEARAIALPTPEKVSEWAGPKDGAAPLPSPLQDLAAAARGYAAAKDSANTRRAYTSDWRGFARWCRRQGFDADQPDAGVVGLFLTASADGTGLPQAAVSTIERRLAAITTHYRTAGTPLDRRDRHIIDVGLPRLSGRVEGLLDYAAMAAAWRCSCS